jgi:hypothetical protein
VSARVRVVIGHLRSRPIECDKGLADRCVSNCIQRQSPVCCIVKENGSQRITKRLPVYTSSDRFAGENLSSNPHWTVNIHYIGVVVTGVVIGHLGQ